LCDDNVGGVSSKVQCYHGDRYSESFWEPWLAKQEWGNVCWCSPGAGSTHWLCIYQISD